MDEARERPTPASDERSASARSASVARRRRFDAALAPLRSAATSSLGPTWQKIVSSFAISFLGASLWRDWAKDRFDRYPDFVAGDAPLRGDLVKVWDYAFLHGALAAFVIWLAVCVATGAFLAIRRGRAAERAFDDLLAICALPAVYAVGKMLMGGVPDIRVDRVNELTILAALSANALVVAVCAGLRRPQSVSLRTESFAQQIGLSTLIPAFVALSASAAATAYARLVIDAEQTMTPEAIQRWIGTAFAVASMAVAATWLAIGHQDRLVRNALAYGVVASQLVLPVAFCLMIPPHVTDGARVEHMFPLSPALVALLLTFTIGGVAWTLIGGIRALRAEKLRLDGLVATPAIAAVLVLLLPRATYLGAADDYHLGELLVSAYMILDHGMLPFADFVATHGLVDPLPVVAGRIFFDDSVDVIQPGILVVNCFLIVAALAIFRRQFGIGLAAVVVFAVMPDYYMASHASRTLVTLMAISIAIRLLLKKRYLTLAIGYMALGPILAFYSLPHGVAGAIAVFPLAAFAAVRALQADRRRALVRGGIAAAAILLIWCVTPLGTMVLKTAQYLLVQSSLNDMAWSANWEAVNPATLPPGMSAGGFEVARWAFLGVFMLATAIVARSLALRARGETPNTAITAYSLVAMLLIFLLLPYAAGRLAPNRFDKTGWLSLVAVCYFLPAIAVAAPRRRVAVITAVTLLFASLAPAPSPIDSLTHKPSDLVALTPADARAVTAAFPRTGRSHFLEQQRYGLRQLSQTLDLYLNEGETFLDASNSSAFYYYLDKPIPLRNLAFVNSHATPDQLAAIRELEKEPVPLLVALGGGIAHNEPRVPLRAPLLFRYLLERYVPLPAGSQVYGVLPERLARTTDALAAARATDGKPPRIRIIDHDDQWWTDGVLTGYDEASLLVDPFSPETMLLQPGRRIVVARSDVRRVTKVEPLGQFIRITLNGPKLDPSSHGFPHRMTLRELARDARDERVHGWDGAWLIRDVGMIPTVWGRSFESLRPLLVKKGDAFAGAVRSTEALTPASGENRWKVDGATPSCRWTFEEPVNGRELGVLAIDARFFGPDGNPLQRPVACSVSWRHAGPERVQDGFAFEAASETLLIPLDASHRWILRGQIRELRIAFEGLPPGSVVELENPRLFQRRDVEELNLTDCVADWYDRD
ncbi:MAG TPA: hypothetical protein VGN57_11600 [Pirellulaceae bacterium]|nr:hypothetical protein [Pirellulaceae bacterium]